MIQIDSEFKELLPALSDEEERLLHESLLANGCLAPITTWKGEDILLDGHNRVEFCDANEVEYYQVDVELPDRDAAKAWILKHALARRNLTPNQISHLRGKQFKLEKQSRGGDRKSKPQTEGLNTAERLAEEHGVSRATIERDAEFASDVDDLPDSRRQEVLSGRERASRAEVREEAAARRKIQEQGSATAQAALEKEAIPLSSLAMLADLPVSKQDAILSGGAQGVANFVRQQTQKVAQQGTTAGKGGKGRQTAPSASGAEPPPKNCQQAIRALERAVDVLKEIMSAESSLKAKGYASLRIQVVVDDLNDLCAEVERKDQD